MGADDTEQPALPPTTGPVHEPPVDAPAPVPLLVPRDGTPEPVDTAEALAEAAARLAAAGGPVAVDAERASGYRYGQRAYLVQLRRGGSEAGGTVLIDPLPFDDLAVVDAAIVDTEWVLHAASQDLPCLAELGLRPRKLFDTELAGRLAGFERVGLGAMTERVLGRTLEKGHSAADWSTRPLPVEWLTYAALDVELLVELRDALAEELERQGKQGWAEEEFAALVASKPPAPRAEPWRRTSGIHRVRTARGLARVRALWEARDEIARRRDLAPGRVLPDSAIVAAAQADPPDERALLSLPVYSGRATRRLAGTWLDALSTSRALKQDELPTTATGGDGPPPAHRWADRDPAAAARLVKAKAMVTALAAEHNLPAENLISPDTVRRVCWAPPDPLDLDGIEQALRTHGAREWQIGLVGPGLLEAAR
ncbi:HRDC domain-containing protein [Cryptosporangium aurantiacum]|uniref:Ribonuclease D n=1 Tax=Cryptosporangium aurantiacum TaxID=134849 RepID=A0A1M7R7F6_9ACTN|nr:ribonuclease D [Cryptosporangium aurantiacum]SHN42166.1 ribonuclease D [Cryptosporangium aurantiacum]